MDNNSSLNEAYAEWSQQQETVNNAAADLKKLRATVKSLEEKILQRMMSENIGSFVAGESRFILNTNSVLNVAT